ncbi:hypothetical protein OIU79_015092 [Salix purpurea]|uniref:Uncharacterized protein n=1 Tax=Salix purpurea TaxID=77065 RepID=A0A9Q0SQ35_SALPP|nr:hypothetical protein OIU79_015092 [Salix purpurea]
MKISEDKIEDAEPNLLHVKFTLSDVEGTVRPIIKFKRERLPTFCVEFSGIQIGSVQNSSDLVKERGPGFGLHHGERQVMTADGGCLNRVVALKKDRVTSQALHVPMIFGRLGVVFEDCRNLLQRGLNFNLSHVSRNANKTVHVLSRHDATVYQFICRSQPPIIQCQALSGDV